MAIKNSVANSKNYEIEQIKNEIKSLLKNKILNENEIGISEVKKKLNG